MGNRERKDKVKEIRKEDIVDAAERVFFAKGFDGATMDDIAREAEYTKRTIYAYFSSKDDLTDAIMLRAFRTLNTLTETKLKEADISNGLEKVVLQGRAFVEFILTYPHYFRTMEVCQTRTKETNYQNKGQNESFQAGEVGIKLLMESVAEGINDGSIRNDVDPVVATFVLWANITGIGSILLNKADYLKDYHHKTVPGLLEEVIDFIVLVLRPV